MCRSTKNTADKLTLGYSAGSNSGCFVAIVVRVGLPVERTFGSPKSGRMLTINEVGSRAIAELGIPEVLTVDPEWKEF